MLSKMPSRPADPRSSLGSQAPRGDWQKTPRPSHHAEEGEGDGSDWATLLKSALVVVLAVAGLTAFLSGMMAQ